MFQSDAGSDCLIQVIENGNLPIQILIDRTHEFAMFLVATQRHEHWMTTGEFYLRFLRRVPTSGEKCTASLETPFELSIPPVTGSDEDSAKEPVSLMHRPASAGDESEEQKIADPVPGASPSLQASNVLFKDAVYYPLARNTDSPQSGETTEEENHAEIGAAALREREPGGGIIPPGLFPPP